MKSVTGSTHWPGLDLTWAQTCPNSKGAVGTTQGSRVAGMGAAPCPAPTPEPPWQGLVGSRRERQWGRARGARAQQSQGAASTEDGMGGWCSHEPGGGGPSPTARGVGAGHGSNHRVSSQSCFQRLRLKPLIQDLVREKRRAPGLGWGVPQHPHRQPGGRLVALCRCCQHSPWRWGL